MIDELDSHYYGTTLEVPLGDDTISISVYCGTSWEPSDRQLMRNGITREKFNELSDKPTSETTGEEFDELDGICDPGGHFERQPAWVAAQMIERLFSA